VIRTLTRRLVLAGATSALTASIAARSARAAPEVSTITPELITAAKKEGRVSWYTSVDLVVAEKVAKAFESRFPGVRVKVERSGAERNFQRISQERTSGIRDCDVVHSSDAAHLIVWKREGMLAAYLPEDVARFFPEEHRDPDGMFATWRVTLSPLAYNTRLVRADDAPRSFADLLDPKWVGKIVKAHPGYSGTIMTATQQTSRDVGWSYFKKLSKQRIMQVQSASDPPRKLAIGERAVMADGQEYIASELKSRGEPIELIYPSEGTPMITSPSAIMARAPHPNAARLFFAWSMTREGQQMGVDVGALRSVHAGVREWPGRPRLGDIKTMREEAGVVADKADEIKARYIKYFKV
jgi:iron(III) transport system substrate-binding protein